jgi:hypothetical protein
LVSADGVIIFAKSKNSDTRGGSNVTFGCGVQILDKVSFQIRKI